MNKQKVIELVQLTKEIENCYYELGKMRIFDHTTLDEADPKYERLRSDVTVEIGGPSTHIKFGVRTKEEHAQVKEMVSTILQNRLDKLERALHSFCEEELKERMEERRGGTKWPE